jgi:lauroyl/myristoyl acyltransferase
MNTPLFFLARCAASLLQALPLTTVARIGRAIGAIVYVIDARHRNMALSNLQMCFGLEKTVQELRSVARENFRRIGENFACAVKTAAMSGGELQEHVELVDETGILAERTASKTGRTVVAIGHFGNFELYARMFQYAQGRKFGTTYRALRQPSLNRLLQSLREKSGCLFFERRFDSAALKQFMNQPQVVLGLLSDQNAGKNGLRLPFLGHECSTTSAPAIFALRYDCALYTGFVFRVGLAKWRIEAGRQIALFTDGKPRRVEEIMRDVNEDFEVAVRRDPANWFWVHNRWKKAPPPHIRHAPVTTQEDAPASG